jgi:hypothetical protein
MLTPSAGLAERLNQLLRWFHLGSLDVPSGLIARDCTLRLNGVSYEESLGRPSGDPLARLVSRGPAAYRFLAQGLRYAVPDAAIRLDDVVWLERPAAGSTIATLTGTPRGSDVPLTASIDVALSTDGQGRLVEIAVRVNEDVLRTLSGARRAEGP